MSDQPTTEPTTTTEQAQEAAPQETPTQPEQPDTTQGAGTQEVDPQVRELRNEAANYRTKLRDAEKALADARAETQAETQKFAEFQAKFNQLFGNEQEVSPEELVKQHQEREQAAVQELNALRMEVALSKAVTAAKADMDLAVPFVKGTAEFAALNPSAEDYPAQVAALVAETVEKYPKLRAQVAPPSSGNTSTPTNNSDPAKLTREDVQKLIAAKRFDEVNAAYAAGRVQ